MNENELKSEGLSLAIKEIERMLHYANKTGYSKAYVCACEEILIYLRPMYERIKGDYSHPIMEIQ